MFVTGSLLPGLMVAGPVTVQATVGRYWFTAAPRVRHKAPATRDSAVAVEREPFAPLPINWKTELEVIALKLFDSFAFLVSDLASS